MVCVSEKAGLCFPLHKVQLRNSLIFFFFFCFMDYRQPLCKVLYGVTLKSEDANLLEVFSQSCQC